MAGNKNSGRRKRFTAEEHLRRGTYRADRHGPLDQPKLEIKPRPRRKPRGGARSQRKWIRNVSDEIAVKNGCRFDEERAEHVAWFFRTYLRFSKGAKGGRPFELNDWQREEIIYPLFGWVRPDGKRRFRTTYIEIPKKNYKSTTAAGIGLYMLVGDGEPGSEVYSLGHNKEQASIVHRAAIAMVDASEELGSALPINRNEKIISFPEENGYYKVLSGEGRGKHGFDIHCAIADELHEWDKTSGATVWKAVKYGMRARDEPLLFVITNAGDDMDSVCYTQREKAFAVLDGKVQDDSFFALVLSATEDEADAEINSIIDGSKEMPVAEQCNPALGDVISHDDLLNQIRDVENDPSERPNLMRLTYGVWVSATGKPLFNLNGWKAGARDVSLPEFYGRHCVAGLDLGETRDFSALVLNFEEDEGYFWWPIFWLPEDVIAKHPMAESLRAWAEDGWLEVTSGDSTDPGYIRDHVAELAENIEITEMAYDPRGAESITQSIEQGVMARDGSVIVEGLGIQRYKFTQSMNNYAAPVKEACNLIARGKIHHPGNPLMDWMMGHTTFKADFYGNKMPVKPGDDSDYRKIDGPAAGLMSQAVQLFGESDGPSVYETRGIRQL